MLVSFCFFYASFLYGAIWRIAKGYAIFPSMVAFSFITVFHQTMIIHKAVSSLAKEADEIIDVLVKSKLTVQESMELLGAISGLLPYMSSVGTSENDKVTLEIVYDTPLEERPER